MNALQKHDLATLLLRLSLGAVLLAHSVYLKLVVFTLPGTAAFFSSIGLPSWLAYVVFAGEATAGIAILLGIHTRWFALAMIPVLLGATWAHADNGWLFTNEGGGWEYPLLLSALAGVQSLLGDGRYSVLNLSPSVGAMRLST